MEKTLDYDIALSAAVIMATEAHIGQVDKGGKPYILHPLRMMTKLADIKDQIVAVLHDVVEDCPGYSVEQFRAALGDELTDAIDAITKRKDEEYLGYLARVKANPIARRVKIQDLADNSDLTRIPNPTAADYERLDRYVKASLYLINQPAT